jgi:hypothetical protein
VCVFNRCGLILFDSIFVQSCDMSIAGVAFYMVAMLLSGDAGGLALVGAWVML